MSPPGCDRALRLAAGLPGQLKDSASAICFLALRLLNKIPAARAKHLPYPSPSPSPLGAASAGTREVQPQEVRRAQPAPSPLRRHPRGTLQEQTDAPPPPQEVRWHPAGPPGGWAGTHSPAVLELSPLPGVQPRREPAAGGTIIRRAPAILICKAATRLIATNRSFP